MFLDESEYSCIGCHSKWSGDITDRLMMVSACVFVCGGVVGVVCCLRTQECALFNTFLAQLCVVL